MQEVSTLFALSLNIAVLPTCSMKQCKFCSKMTTLQMYYSYIKYLLIVVYILAMSSIFYSVLIN